jgi:chromosome segregation ATPase
MAKNQPAPTAETPAASEIVDPEATGVTELGAARADILRLEAELHDAKGGLEAAGKEVERLQGELRGHASALSEAGEALVKLRNELDAERDRGAELSRTLDSVRAQRDEAEEELERRGDDDELDEPVKQAHEEATSDTSTPHIDDLPEDHPLKR